MKIIEYFKRFLPSADKKDRFEIDSYTDGSFYVKELGAKVTYTFFKSICEIRYNSYVPIKGTHRGNHIYISKWVRIDEYRTMSDIAHIEECVINSMIDYVNNLGDRPEVKIVNL